MKINKYKFDVCPTYKKFNKAKWGGEMFPDELPPLKVKAEPEENDEPFDAIEKLWSWEVQFENAEEDGTIGAWDLDLLHFGYVIGSTRHGSLVQISSGIHSGKIYNVPEDIWERLEFADFSTSDPDSAPDQLGEHGAIYMAQNFATFYRTYSLQWYAVEFTNIVGAGNDLYGFGYGRYYGRTDVYDPQVYDLNAGERIPLPEEQFEDVAIFDGQLHAVSYEGQFFTKDGAPLNDETDVTVNYLTHVGGELFGVDTAGCNLHRWSPETKAWEHVVAVEECNYLYGIVGVDDRLLLLGQKRHYELRAGVLTESPLEGDYRFRLYDGARLILTGKGGVFTGTLDSVEDTLFDNEDRLVGNIVSWRGRILCGLFRGIVEVTNDDVVWFSEEGGRLRVLGDELYRLQGHRLWKWEGTDWSRIRVFTD